jgi:hypothetical protein
MENGLNGGFWYDRHSIAGLSNGDVVIEAKANPTQGA